MPKLLVNILIALILPVAVAAQDGKAKAAAADSSNLIIKQLESGTHAGKVKVVQDPRLTTILRKHFEYNRTSGLPGWRILIYRGRDMSRANQTKADYEESFESLGLPVSVEYSEPDFSTLVGAFRTKEDAYRYKQKLIARFPQAYLVPVRLIRN